jgi:hypothetical protein
MRASVGDQCVAGGSPCPVVALVSPALATAGRQSWAKLSAGWVQIARGTIYGVIQNSLRLCDIRRVSLGAVGVQGVLEAATQAPGVRLWEHARLHLPVVLIIPSSSSSLSLLRPRWTC